ncbi:hypothetical protein Q1695_011597 [Nippostrongylus brasiliensis]|nr:hypothetical protein Q1695_011597 [Nippostrongylus brasiliensis]
MFIQFQRELIGKEPSEFFFVDSKSNVGFYGTELLTIGNISLWERLTCNFNSSAAPQIIFTDFEDTGTLDGCPDWNCVVTRDPNELPQAGAVISTSKWHLKGLKPDQYRIFYSQESPAYYGVPSLRHRFNMTLGFNHDSPIASPYGYTMKLAKKSRRSLTRQELEIINGKTKAVAWFVSNCGAISGRTEYYEKLKDYISVDMFGYCGNDTCSTDSHCESNLDTLYHFYLSFENAMCEYYITEKLWKHGYMHLVVPVVLKRSIVEPFVPPYSFVAVDDFSSPKELAEYMSYLIANKTAYLEYFEWRRDYRVIFLDGRDHNRLERPWGLCQLCRLLWERPRKRYKVKDILKQWYNTCESEQILQLLPRYSRRHHLRSHPSLG